MPEKTIYGQNFRGIEQAAKSRGVGSAEEQTNTTDNCANGNVSDIPYVQCKKCSISAVLQRGKRRNVSLASSC